MTLRRRTGARLEILDTITQALEHGKEQLEQLPELGEETLQARRDELEDTIDRVAQRREQLKLRTDRHYRRVLRILRANPTAMTREFGEAMEDLRELDDED